MKPFVIPIFISHQGCPHQCIFCDQHAITGHKIVQEQPITPARVKESVAFWLNRPRKDRNNNVQVAFYGGSFTGIPQQEQRGLLGAVQSYIKQGSVACIRISTRPDYIDAAAIALLKEYSVTIVELGIQSLDQDVLTASARAHSVQQSKDAVRMLKENGFMVGAQLMCGLPGDNTVKLMTTARKTAELGSDFVRIYPTLVIKGSGLEKISRSGNYRPLSLAEAVALSCRMKDVFDDHGIRVVRMGLQPSEELAEKVVAGPYHPAFGELVIARALFKKARKILRQKVKSKRMRLSIAAADESVFRGPNNVSIKRLTALGLLDGIEFVFDKEQARNTVRLG